MSRNATVSAPPCTAARLQLEDRARHGDSIASGRPARAHPPYGVYHRQRDRPADRLAPTRTAPRIKFLKFKRRAAAKSFIYRGFQSTSPHASAWVAYRNALILNRDSAFIRGGFQRTFAGST